MKILLVAGHNEQQKGAKNIYTNENDLAKILISSIITETDKRLLPEDDPLIQYAFFKDNKRDKYALINLTGHDLVVYFHFNAFDTTTWGHETLYVSDKGKAFAKRFNEIPLNRDRGIKRVAKKKRGWSALTSVKAPAIILEPMFIDNKADYKSFMIHLPCIVKRYVALLKELANE